jgi:hypothetical protein
MYHERNCAEQSCLCTSVASLNEQDLCLEHFLSSCYEMLEQLDPRGRSFSSQPVDMASMRAFIEECSRKALDISLHSKNLNNLERGRLLDILLWAGELFLLLRAPRLTFYESAASVDAPLVSGAVVPSF